MKIIGKYILRILMFLILVSAILFFYINDLKKFFFTNQTLNSIILIVIFCGIIFGIGLVVSEMINPAKVLGFLNLFDAWDPSLAFVMIGALIVSTPLFHLFKLKP